MAIGSTVYNFDVELSDSGRGVYESLSLRVARHSSESMEYLLCRVLAYCFEYVERLEFTKGLDDPEMPAIWAKDLTGRLTHWIEVGAPSADKLHKAAKTGSRVAIYAHKNPATLLEQLRSQNIYRSHEVELHAIAPTFIAEVAEVTERRNVWALSLSEGSVYLDVAGRSFSTSVESFVVGG